MYQPTDQIDALEEEFKELVANKERRRTLLRQLRDHFPEAFAALEQRLQKDWDARVARATAEVAPPYADLPEGNLDEEPEPLA